MKKNKISKILLLSIFTLFIFLSSCSEFLNDPDATIDPNRAVEGVTADQFLNAIQVSQFFRYEGHLARTTGVWMEQLSGTDLQGLQLAKYESTETEWSGEMNGAYTGGGLIDIRNIQKEAKAKGWKAYEGIAKVWEAFIMGTAASLWGDLPYSEAVSQVKTPKLDRQADIYAAVQKLLDEAIADLTAGTGVKPANDYVYSGNTAKWLEAAYTLKARFYMHWAEVSATNYDLALAAIQKGISTNANNFRSKHTDVESESHANYQFWKTRTGNIRSGKFMVDLLKARNDGRIDKYFAKTAAGDYVGAAPGQQSTTVSNLSVPFLAKNFTSEFITYTEALLIWAECSYKKGDNATAIAKLNAARRAEEARWSLPANSLGVAAGLTGAALIQEIMLEKYIALFMNIETYNDWKRTNLPVVLRYNNMPIPRRLLYSTGERNANPNIPVQQPARNQNDPGETY